MYSYQTEKSHILTDDGQRTFLAVRDNVQRLLKLAGAVRMQEAWSGTTGKDTWALMACVDRLVELKEIKELSNPDCAGQHRVFISAK